MTGADKRLVLEAFSRDFTRELHNLRAADLGRSPQFLFRQLHDGLQWHVTAGVAAERITVEAARRCAPGRSAWLHLRTRQRESEALVRTLVGHGDGADGAALGPVGAATLPDRTGAVARDDQETNEETPAPRDPSAASSPASSTMTTSPQGG